MANGYFGKLPMRGDFVTRDCPAGFLKLWEPFLAAGLARAREDLSAAWEEAYMTMPVWRFYIEPVCSDSGLEAAIAGVMMANVDRVGRKYPLTLVNSVGEATAGQREPSEWFGRAEAVVLKTLADDADFERFQGDVAELPAPTVWDLPDAPRDEVAVPASAHTQGQLRAGFWCMARGQSYAVRSDGLPDEAVMQILVRPEGAGRALSDGFAGDIHGRSREDLRS